MQKKLKFLWLLTLCVTVLVMITVGGYTRLSGSGLSITEWKPVTGILPPTTEFQWQEEFGKYKLSPEYLKVNFDMSLEDFKEIFWPEFIHRNLGRFIGILYFVPYLLFLKAGTIRKNEFLYILSGLIFSMQGFMGWYMVKSGLVSNPHVSHFRLGAHLFLASILYSLLFYKMLDIAKNEFLFLDLKPEYQLGDLPTKDKATLFFLIIITFAQIFLGACVAGLKAGLVYNEFPLMGDGFFPEEAKNISAGDLFNNPVIVQLIHRLNAYLIFALSVYITIKLFILRRKKLAILLISLCSLQMFLGIITLLLQVPLLYALLHQIFAFIFLSSLLIIYKTCSK